MMYVGKFPDGRMDTEYEYKRVLSKCYPKSNIRRNLIIKWTR